MDVSSFFSRLVQPSGSKNQGVLRPADDPSDFDAAWQAVQDTLEYPDERQIVRGIAFTDVPRHLRHIVDALVCENSRNNGDETGPCFEYLIRNDLLSTLAKLSEPDRPHGIKSEVVRSLNNLIVLLSDRFLNHNAVHGPLRRLLRSCVGDDPVEGQSEGVKRVFGAAGMDQRRGGTRDEEAEADLVDLMCILCSKMRAYPPLLLIFFHDKSTPSGPPSNPLSRTLSPTPSGRTSVAHPSARHSTSSRGQQRFEFLLFSYLLRFVHREGRTGDFARAGLLFLFDIAFLPVPELTGEPEGQGRKGENEALQDAQDALGEYILDGDFAAVMAAALGAVYSLLPSELRVPTLADQAGGEDGEQGSGSGGKYLGGSAPAKEGDNMPCTTDPDVRRQLDLLLKLFAFLQDIITRCSSSALSSSQSTPSNTHILGAAVSDSTLDAIQSSFLDNILYPSILESSPADGTSVAVMTYLHVVLSNIDDGPLLTRLLHFLLDTDSDEGPRLAPHHLPKRGAKAASERDGHRSEYFVDAGKFTIKDLILDNLGSKSSVSRTVALQLLQTMLQEHCASAVDGLLSITRLHSPHSPSPTPCPPELELYSSLLTSLNPSAPPFDQSPSYASYLVDITSVIQSDRCFRLDQLDETFASEDEKAEIARAKRKCVPGHRLSPGDPIIREIILGLAGWMRRTPDENVGLASVIISLAGCSRRCLEGWLTVASKEAEEGDPWDTAPHKSHDDPFTANPAPPSAPEALPALYQLLSSHTTHIAHLQRSIPQFPQLLAERRHALLFADNLDEAMNLNLEMDAFGSAPPSQGLAPPRPPITPLKAARGSLAGSIKGFFSPRKKGASSASGEGVGSPAGTPGLDEREEPVSPGMTPARPDVEGGGVTVVVEPVDLPQILSGPWCTETPRRPAPDRSISEWSNGAPFTPAPKLESEAGEKGKEEKGKEETIGLDQTLDNVVILEEFLKELLAIITARRALRIDPARS